MSPAAPFLDSLPVSHDPLVGRDREMAALRDRLDALLAGQGSVVLVAGEAGIGKTALVEWFAAEARTAGARFFGGHCFDLAQTPPYGPWRTVFAGMALPEEVTGDPFALPPDSERGASAGQSRLFDRVDGMLAGAGASQPLVIALEDVHWADPASLELLRFVAHGIRRLPVLVVATYRGDELSPRDPLFALLPRLIREADPERITLGPLDDEAMRLLVRRRYALPAPDEARLAAYLRRRADGNPLFITEMLRTLHIEQVLTQVADGWRVGDLSHAPVPPLIRQIIEERLARLPAGTLPLLEVAAAIGQDVPLTIWEAVSGATRDDLLRVSERALGARLVRESLLPQRLVFTHALVRDAVYGRQSLLVRQDRHRRIAETLAARDDDAPNVVASHFAFASDPRAIDWFIRAGEQALALYAARDARAALNHAQEIATRFSRPLPAAAYRVRATAAALLGEFDQARWDHELALERGRATGDRRAEWQALLDLGMLWAERDYERTAGYYEGALALARSAGDAPMIAYSLNRVGNCCLNQEEPSRAIPLHEEALALFRERDDRAGIADTLDFLAVASYLDADFRQGARYAEEAIGLFRERDDRQRQSSCLNVLALSGGDITWIAVPPYREARYWLQAGEEALVLARDIGWSAGEAFALITLSNISFTRGDLGRALRDAEAGLRIAERIGHEQWAIAARQAAGAAWIEFLDEERAARELEQALAAARAAGLRFWITTLVAMLSSLYVAEGDLERAAATLGATAQPGTRRLSLSQRQCRFAQAELTLARGEPARALEIVDELIRSRPRPAPDDPLPQLRKLRGDALARLGREDDAEQAFAAACRDAALLGYLPLLWRIEQARGDLLLGMGRTTEAAEAIRRVHDVIGQLATSIADPALRTRFATMARDRLPELPPTSQPAEAVRLSPRERDVLRHLAEGKSDREIAAALSISPRTVMRHVTSILTKLGVSSRTAAATLAIREEIV